MNNGKLIMKKNWEIKKLGEVCEVIAGQSPESKYYNSIGTFQFSFIFKFGNAVKGK